MLVDNYFKMFEILKKNGLLVEYYTATDFSLCRVADWSLMAIATHPNNQCDSDGDISSVTYFAWHIDLEYGKEIIENNSLFIANMISNKTSREHDLTICSEDCLEKLKQIRDEVQTGKRECLIDEEFEKVLKKEYMKTIEPYVELYGNPPVFNQHKLRNVLLAFFLYPFGLPGFVAGDRKNGFIQLAIGLAAVLASAIMPPVGVAFLVAAVINIFVFYFKVFTGKITDEKGRPVLTESKKSRISDMIARYNQYSKDIGEDNDI